MEEPKIVCKFEPGILMQKVLIYNRPDSKKANPEVYLMKYEQIANFIFNESKTIKNIYLSGVSYLVNNAAEKLEEKENLYYNNNEEKMIIHIV